MSRNKAELAVYKQIKDWVELLGTSGGFCGMGENSIASRLRTVEVRAEGFDGPDDHKQPVPRRGKAKVEVTNEIVVTEDMCNAAGNLHGGCGMYLCDVCTSFALKPWSALPGWDYTGVSTDLHARFVNAAPLGATLRLVSTLTSIGARLATVDFRIYNKDTGQLCVVGSHSKASMPTAKL